MLRSVANYVYLHLFSQSIINRLDSYDPLRFKAVIVDEVRDPFLSH